jgi:hypothetical protein
MTSIPLPLARRCARAMRSQSIGPRLLGDSDAATAQDDDAATATSLRPVPSQTPESVGRLAEMAGEPDISSARARMPKIVGGNIDQISLLSDGTGSCF